MKNKIVLVVLYIFLIFLIACQQAVKKETGQCTKEAYLCPDGSYVGRTGPNCEFTCPATPKVDAAVDAVGKDLNSTDAVANDLSTDPLGNLDSGLSDVQNI